jgi:hypothetical protein
LEEFKTKSSSKQKCTLEDKLGGFLISKDTQNKVAKEKDSRKTDSDQQEQPADTTIKPKKGSRNQHLMLAMDAKDQIPCISCGYPILWVFGPEKLLRFGRKDCCSSGCFITHCHYKDQGEEFLQRETVKITTDSLRAATSFAIKTLRRCNAEEVVGGRGVDLSVQNSSKEAAAVNMEDLAEMLKILVTYAMNATKGVGQTCNNRLSHANTFGDLIKGGTVMGASEPALFGKKKARWVTAMTGQKKGN